MNRFSLIVSALSILIATGSNVSFAQDSASEEKEKNCLFSGSDMKIDEDANCLAASDILGGLNLTTPENSLFTLLNATPDTVIRPKSGDKFGLSLLPQAVSAFGENQYAVGFEINPGLLVMPKSFSANDLAGVRQAGAFSDSYKTMQRAKFLSKFSISGMASRSTDGQEIARHGLGLNYNFDTGSPLYSQKKYGKCMGTYLKSTRDEFTNQLDTIVNSLMSDQEKLKADFQKKYPRTAVTVVALRNFASELSSEKLRKSDWFKNSYQTALQKGVKKCVDEASPWNRDTYGGGVAFYHSDVTEPTPLMDDTEQISADGFGIWAATTQPVGKNGQIALSAKYNDDLIRERKQGEGTITETVDGWLIGARYTHDVSADNAQALRYFVEAAYAEEDFGMIKDDFTQAGIGVEAQIQDNLFFQATIGDTFGSEIDRSTYLSGQFKWSFSKAAAK